jgi:hypothetical protein
MERINAGDREENGRADHHDALPERHVHQPREHGFPL